MTAFILTRHRHLPGVRLSKPGHWGNIPFDDDAAALAAAEADAGGPIQLRRDIFGQPR